MKKVVTILLGMIFFYSCSTPQLVYEDKSNEELTKVMKKYSLTEVNAKTLIEAFEPGSGYDEFRGVSVHNLNDVRVAISNGRNVLVVKYHKGTTFVNINQPNESKLE